MVLIISMEFNYKICSVINQNPGKLISNPKCRLSRAREFLLLASSKKEKDPFLYHSSVKIGNLETESFLFSQFRAPMQIIVFVKRVDDGITFTLITIQVCEYGTSSM